MPVPALSDFPRPMGVHGAPHVGDVAVSALPDLSPEKQGAVEDLKNALMILAPCREGMLGEALTRLIRSALTKLEGDADFTR